MQFLVDVGLGIVLSGGGALGAYEAGVLGYAFTHIAPRLGPVAVRAIAGTSIGGFNGAYLGSILDDPREGARRLMAVWEELSMGDVLRLDPRGARVLAQTVTGGAGAIGLFDGRLPRALFARTIDWAKISRAFASGALGALTVSATRISTGEAVVFLQRGRSVEAPGPLGANVLVKEAQIGPAHVAASGAIPVVFPPVEIDGELFLDGGLCQNTPIAPAIHLGADHLLIVSISSRAHRREVQVQDNRTPGLAFLLGKAINAFMLDHVSHDVEHLDRINQILAAAEHAWGPAALSALAAGAPGETGFPLRIVERVVVQPSQDIGSMAAAYLRGRRPRVDRLLERALFKLLDVGEERDADLASYLLFDGGFTRQLVELGWGDASREEEALARLLGASPATRACARAS